MLQAVAAIIAGLVLLVWSAERFVFGASATARNLGVSPMLIGLTIVAIGTSAPEMLVSAIAAWEDRPGLAIGNAVGSNIANIALVLGATALVAPMTVASDTLRREFPAMILTMLAVLVLLLDGELGRLDGMLMLAGGALIIGWITLIGARARRGDPLGREYAQEIPATVGTGRALGWTLVGLLLLLLSSRLVVWGAATTAHALGVSDVLIGLTIVAIGTSLPELAASTMSAHKGEPDIAIGNVIGSNMFNLLPVLGLPGLISPGTLPPGVLSRDYPVMLVLTLALFAMAYRFRTPRRINRLEGGVLLTAFFAYQALLYLTG